MIGGAEVSRSDERRQLVTVVGGGTLWQTVLMTLSLTTVISAEYDNMTDYVLFCLIFSCHAMWKDAVAGTPKYWTGIHVSHAG